MGDIFLQIDNASHGPYAAGEVEEWLREGRVTPSTLAWREGMAEWKPLATWGAAAAESLPVPAEVPPPVPQPYYHPPGAGYVPSGVMPGFNRFQYVIVWMLANVLLWGVFWLVAVVMVGATEWKSITQEGIQRFYWSLGLGFAGALLFLFGLMFWLGAKRLQNIGWKSVLIVLMLVPGLNAFLALALLALPPDFARTRKLDGPAMALIVVALLFVGSFITLALTTDMIARLKGQLDSLPHLKDFLESIPYLKGWLA